ncbi:agglutinin cell wall attachment protein [Nocardioides sp. NPDC047086]|uniref:agglutinin cell wall attachment protein n=1 Tax=Nocardioides sp. NPDC047086 TaxID=3154810 RepID=UPI0033EBE906
MSVVDVIAPSTVRQEHLFEQIAIRLPDEVDGDWTAVVFNHRNLSSVSDGRIDIHRPGGYIDYSVPPDVVIPLIEELRQVMYRPGRGTWLSGQWTITDIDGNGEKISADASFNRDDEPLWRRAVNPEMYALDLEAFPRDQESTPDWLRQKVAEARRAS